MSHGSSAVPPRTALADNGGPGNTKHPDKTIGHPQLPRCGAMNAGNRSAESAIGSIPRTSRSARSRGQSGKEFECTVSRVQVKYPIRSTRRASLSLAERATKLFPMAVPPPPRRRRRRHAVSRNLTGRGFRSETSFTFNKIRVITCPRVTSAITRNSYFQRRKFVLLTNNEVD